MSDSPNVQTTDPLILYSRSLHKYTLALWTESRRLAEEKARIQQARRRPVSYQHSTEPAEATKSDKIHKTEDSQSTSNHKVQAWTLLKDWQFAILMRES